MANCKLVRNANHKYDLVNISYDSNMLVFRLFEAYYGPTDGMNTIPANDLIHNTTEYQGGSILTYEGQNYRQIWMRNQSFEENQIHAGGTYMLATDDVSTWLFRLDAEKYPDLEISDWKYARSHSLRPIVKFILTKNNQNGTDIQKVYYLNSGIGSTKFIVPDTLDESTTYEDKDISIVPEIIVVEGQSAITFNLNSSVAGELHFANQKNLITPSAADIKEGVASISIQKLNESLPASFDVLYGFNYVKTITLS